MGTPNPYSLENRIEVWKKAIETQIHFNDLLMKMRMTVVSIVLAVFGTAVVSLRDLTLSITFWGLNIHISILIIGLGLIFLIGQYFIDRYYYMQLLIGAVQYTERLDKEEKIFGLTTAISDRISLNKAENLVDLYYLLPLVIGIISIIFLLNYFSLGEFH